MTHLAATTTVAGLAQALAAQIRNLTGHDRVMVYRFDQDWNGEVIAEDRREDLEPFLGLHYPASDIPAQARRLYATSWTRVIADVAYEPSPLVPAATAGPAEPLDLSLAVLRSVSPIHIEYLTNMGVRASMSVSLIQDGRLWGLVACHHYSGPRCPSHDARSAAEFVGQAASQLLRDRQAADDRAEQQRQRPRPGPADRAPGPRPASAAGGAGRPARAAAAADRRHRGRAQHRRPARAPRPDPG